MAAAEYFDPRASIGSLPGPAQQQQHHQPPPSNPAPANLNPPYPMSDQPPPYSYSDTNLPRPHSQPPPGQRVPQANFNAAPYPPYRPNPAGQPDGETHQYPPEKVPPPQQQQAQRAPSFQNNYRPPEPPGAYPPQQNGYPNGYHAYPTPAAPGLSQVYAGQNWPQQQQQRPNPAGNAGYQRPSRSRSRSREKRKHHKQQKPELQRQKSKGMNTFLGAGGGAIIGDLIFPGLGTLSGAVLGGIGGHEYGKGKKRSSSNPGRGYRRSYSSGEEDYRRGRK